MCIALLSTAHPSYQLILIDNRDEYLNRPTAVADWWSSPNENVLGGRDLLRDAQGTWLGVTKEGKIAVLTNFRENPQPPPTALSRGMIIRKWLTEDVGSTEDFVSNVVNTGIARDAGGFSLVCGNIGDRLAVISNRAADHSQVPWICGSTVQTVGLSNAAFGDRSWKKVQDGEEFMLHTIRQCIQENASEDLLIERLLEMLSRDTLERADSGTEVGLETYIMKLRNTILVPPLGRKDMTDLPGDEIAGADKKQAAAVIVKDAVTAKKQLGISGLYGTQKQTVVLVDHDFRVRFFERTLFDTESDPIPRGKGDVDFTFKINR